MKTIENEVYYHIQTKVPYKGEFWKVGETHFLGDGKNPFTRYFDIAGLSKVKNIESVVNHYQKFARETIFEEVRSTYFPSLPSRFKCLWVIPEDEATIDYWKGQLIEGKESQLVKVKLTGILHKANQSFLGLNLESMDYNRQQAFKYWNGVSGSGSMEDEYLFQGFAEVVEVTGL